MTGEGSVARVAVSDRECATLVAPSAAAPACGPWAAAAAAHAPTADRGRLHHSTSTGSRALGVRPYFGGPPDAAGPPVGATDADPLPARAGA
jgi:hypothetical protein